MPKDWTREQYRKMISLQLFLPKVKSNLKTALSLLMEADDTFDKSASGLAKSSAETIKLWWAEQNKPPKEKEQKVVFNSKKETEHGEKV